MGTDADALRQAALWDIWAEQVDDLYGGRDPGAAVDYLQRIAPGPDVLELGAGTGRVALPLSERGFNVRALEISSKLAARLRLQDQGRNVDVIEEDMASYVTSAPMHLIYAARSTFFQITTQERQLACLRTCAQNLKPDGRLLLDCYVPDADVLSRAQNLTVKSFETSGLNLRATIVGYNSQTIAFREVHLGADGTRVLPVEQRFCWPSELDLMARMAGLRLETRVASFHGEPFDDDSRRHVSLYCLDHLGPAVHPR